MFSFFKSRGQTNCVQSIDPREAVAKAKAGEMIVIDVREMSEVKASGKAACAVHIPLMKLAMQADPRSPEFNPVLNPETPVVLYCAAGGRSQRAAQMLIDMGYQQVYNLGGFCDWQAAGGTITR